MKQGADIGFLGFAGHELLAGRSRQSAGQIGAQKGFLQLSRIALVLHVFKQQHRNCDVAQGIESEHDHGARNGADGAATGPPVMRRVHQAQNLVGQAIVLENRIGQPVDALLVGMGQLVDRRYRIRQRREIRLVLHAADQEFQRVLFPRLGGLRRINRRRRGAEIAVQFQLQLRSAGGAQSRIASAGFQNDAGKLVVDAHVRRQRDRLVEDLMNDSDRGLPAYPRLTGKHLDHHQPGRIDIGFFADLAAVDILRRQVIERARNTHLILFRFDGVEARGNAEIHHARAPLRIDQDVGRLQVAMNDPRRMSHCQRIEYLTHQVGRARSGDAAFPRDEFGEVGAVDKLEHKIGVAVFLACIENRHQIGVSQATDRTGFGQQRVIALRVRA